MWLQPQALSLSTLYGRSDQLNPPTSHRGSEHIASDPQHFQLTLAGHFASDPLSIHEQHVISQKQQTPMVCDTVAASQLRLQKLYYEQQQKKQDQRKLNWLLGQQHQIKSQNESRTMQLSNLPPTDQQQQHIHSEQQQQKFGDSTTLLAVYDSGLRASTAPLETNAAGQAKVANTTHDNGSSGGGTSEGGGGGWKDMFAQKRPIYSGEKPHIPKEPYKVEKAPLYLDKSRVHPLRQLSQKRHYNRKKSPMY